MVLTTPSYRRGRRSSRSPRGHQNRRDSRCADALGSPVSPRRAQKAGTMTNDVVPRDVSIEELTRVRACIDRLAGIMGVPALWASGQAPADLNSALDALLARAGE